jgi:hypothetical protein
MEYFIAAKVFYAFADPNPSNFAGISIKTEVYDSTNKLIPNTILFTTEYGEAITL